jgi:hypothetical protein
MTAAQPTGGRNRPPGEPRHQQRHTDDPHRLTDQVAEQDAQRDRRADRALQEAGVDDDARVREREQRDDHVTRPRVVQVQEPLVRRDRRAEAHARRALEFRRGLLPERAEALAGAFELRPGDGVGPDQQAHRQPYDHRLDAGTEQRYPARHPEHEVQRTPAHADRAEPEHRGEEPERPEQGGELQVIGVRGPDHHQREEVIDHHHREDERPQAVRHATAGQPQQSECQGGVGRHRDPPAARGRAAQVEREVDRDRGGHPADRGEHRQRDTPPLTQLAEVEFAPRLQTDHEEEERHQPAVHPLAQRQLEAPAPERERQLGPPELLVGRRVDVHPDQRGDGGHEDDRGPARLGSQELAQRRLEPADPRRAFREEVSRPRQPTPPPGRGGGVEAAQVLGPPP